MKMNEGIYLLTIRGSLIPTTVEQARTVHNQTAGDPNGVAAARSLGDLSHNIYVPLADKGGAASELLFLDLWNNLDGLNRFFSDPQVQAGGGMMFKTRDPVVWAAADIGGFALPTPIGSTERYVGMIRGTVASRDKARPVLDGYATKAINAARMLGQVSHQMFYRLTPPGEPASNELVGIDVWSSAEGMGKWYEDKTNAAGLYELFTAPPVASVWRQPAGSWVEW